MTGSSSLLTRIDCPLSEVSGHSEIHIRMTAVGRTVTLNVQIQLFTNQPVTSINRGKLTEIVVKFFSSDTFKAILPFWASANSLAE